MSAEQTRKSLELAIPNSTRYLSRVREAVREVVGASGFSESENHRIILAVDEAISNIMEHAYEQRRQGSELTIRMRLNADATKFEVVIHDSGKVFNPREMDTPDISEHIASGRRSGLGIFLMRQIMDEVKYTFVHGFRNELCMVKYVRSEPLER